MKISLAAGGNWASLVTESQKMSAEMKAAKRSA